MGQGGIVDSSNSLSINFCTINNDKNTLKELKKLQIANNKPQKKNAIKLKFFSENGAPFVVLKTNLNDKPLKFLIDTGAAVSLISDDVISPNNEKLNNTINIYGIMGKEVSVKTKGVVTSVFILDEKFLSTNIHVIDKKHLGLADGYLGYDFLEQHKIIIDIKEMCLKINNYYNEREIKNINAKLIGKEEIIYPGIELLSPNNMPKREINNSQIHEEGNIVHSNTIIKCNEINGKLNNAMEINKISEKNEKNESISNINEVAENFLQVLALNYEFEDINHQRNNNNNNDNLNMKSREENIYENLNLKECNEEEKEFIRKICSRFQNQFYLDGDVLNIVLNLFQMQNQSM